MAISGRDGGGGAGDFSNIANQLNSAVISFGQLTGSVVAFSSALGAFKTLEKQLISANVVAGGTAVEFGRMEDAVRNFALTSTTSAAEAAGGLYDLASAGFSVTESLEAMSGVIILAEATLKPVGEVADLVSATLQAFKLQASDSMRVANLFAAATANSLATLDKLAFAFRQVAPFASAAGLSIEETTAALSVLFDVGLRGEQAGTALRNVIAGLTDPVGDAKAILDGLNIGTIDLATGDLRKYSDIMKDLAKANLSAADAVQLFGREALAGALTLIDSFKDKTGQTVNAFDEMLVSISNTSKAYEISRKQLGGLSAQIDIASNAITEFAIAVGDEMAPLVKDMALGLKSMAEGFRELSPELRESTGKLIAFLATVITLGTLLRGMGGLLNFATFGAAGKVGKSLIPGLSAEAVKDGAVALGGWQKLKAQAVLVAESANLLTKSQVLNAAKITGAFAGKAFLVAGVAQAVYTLIGGADTFQKAYENIFKTSNSIKDLKQANEAFLSQINDIPKQFQVGTLGGAIDAVYAYTSSIGGMTTALNTYNKRKQDLQAEIDSLYVEDTKKYRMAGGEANIVLASGKDGLNVEKGIQTLINFTETHKEAVTSVLGKSLSKNTNKSGEIDFQKATQDYYATLIKDGVEVRDFFGGITKVRIDQSKETLAGIKAYAESPQAISSMQKASEELLVNKDPFGATDALLEYYEDNKDTNRKRLTDLKNSMKEIEKEREVLTNEMAKANLRKNVLIQDSFKIMSNLKPEQLTQVGFTKQGADLFLKQLNDGSSGLVEEMKKELKSGTKFQSKSQLPVIAAQIIAKNTGISEGEIIDEKTIKRLMDSKQLIIDSKKFGQKFSEYLQATSESALDFALAESKTKQQFSAASAKKLQNTLDENFNKFSANIQEAIKAANVDKALSGIGLDVATQAKYNNILPASFQDLLDGTWLNEAIKLELDKNPNQDKQALVNKLVENNKKYIYDALAAYQRYVEASGQGQEIFNKLKDLSVTIAETGFGAFNEQNAIAIEKTLKDTNAFAAKYIEEAFKRNSLELEAAVSAAKANAGAVVSPKEQFDITNKESAVSTDKAATNILKDYFDVANITLEKQVELKKIITKAAQNKAEFEDEFLNVVGQPFSVDGSPMNFSDSGNTMESLNTAIQNLGNELKATTSKTTNELDTAKEDLGNSILSLKATTQKQLEEYYSTLNELGTEYNPEAITKASNAKITALQAEADAQMAQLKTERDRKLETVDTKEEQIAITAEYNKQIELVEKILNLQKQAAKRDANKQQFEQRFSSQQKLIDEEKWRSFNEADFGGQAAAAIRQSALEADQTLATIAFDQTKSAFDSLADAFGTMMSGAEVDWRQTILSMAQTFQKEMMSALAKIAIAKATAAAMGDSASSGSSSSSGGSSWFSTLFSIGKTAAGSMGGGGGGSGGNFSSGGYNSTITTDSSLPWLVNAHGNVFGKGGLVDAPTFFNYGNGKLGEMGEAGTEGIFPLFKNGGALGVYDASGGALSVVRLPNGKLGVDSSNKFADGGVFGSTMPLSSTGGNSTKTYTSSSIQYNIDARGADAGVEERLRKLMMDMEKNRPAQIMNTVRDANKRNPKAFAV